jgi:hypothetical protein
MPGDPHPLAVVYGAGNVDKAAVIADGKIGYRRIVADNNEIRNTDLSGQYGGLYVRATRRRYYLDTESIASDDDESVIIDAAGNHFLFETEGSEPLSLTYTDADVQDGEITLGEDVDIAYIDTMTSVTLLLPAQGTRGGRSLTIKDIGGTGFSMETDGSETIDDTSAGAFQVTTPKGYIVLGPLTGGYAVLSSQL